MSKTILLTSFAPWLAQQPSNSSDDLLLAVLAQKDCPPNLHILRQLPVNTPVAMDLAIARIQALQPDVVISCGMAESRRQLTVESRAIAGQRVMYTSIDLETLTAGLMVTAISHDAGQFVCNAFYAALLNYLRQAAPQTAGLFVHVPRLTPQNQSEVLKDFRLILERLSH